MTNSSTSSNSTSSSRNGPGRLGWTGAVGIAIAALLIWWTLHDVSLVEVWDNMRHVQVLPFVAALTLATLTFPLRTIRWQYLLRLEGATLPFVPLWHATAIGFTATNLLPARAGEFARAYAARRMTGARFSTAFASIAVERVLDGITLVALLVIGIWAGGFGAGTSIGPNLTLGDVARASGVLFFVLLVVALLAVHWPSTALRLTRSFTNRVLPDKWSLRLTEVVEGLVSGLDALRSPSRFGAVLLWSLVVWLTGAASFWMALRAFGIETPWSATLLLQSLLAFGVAVQFSPGFFGQWEAICRITLGLYGVAAGSAVSFAFGFHLGGFFPITLLGMWSLSRAHLHLADLRRRDALDEVAPGQEMLYHEADSPASTAR
ncbi:MAG: flippase-like domain-containing protein [Gemmatimonadota bacterium]|nr:MAG: flippase-like domain-containing protein [Gemmatimonadota bacterium]